MAFEYDQRVRLDDVDRFDIAFYPRVFVWLQRASEALFEAGGRPYPAVVRDTGCRYPIVSADAEYARQIPWGERVDMTLTVSLGRTSFGIDATGRVDGERAFEVSRTQVAVDEASGEKTPLPGVVREALEPFVEAD